MKIRVSLKSISRFAKRCRYNALINKLNRHGLPIKGKPMSEKPKKSELIAELQELIDSQADLLSKSVKKLSELTTEVTTLKRQVADLKQACTHGQ